MADAARTWRLLGPLVGDGFAQLRAQWRGHALTLIGLVWGAAAVVLLLSIGAGFNQFLDLGVAKTGDRYLMVWGEYTTTESGGAQPGRPIRLDIDDLERARASAPSAARAGAEIQRYGIAVETPRKTRSGVVAAVSPEIGVIQVHHMARGRFLDDADERIGRHVAVIGAGLTSIFFGDEDPLGRTLQLDGTPFEVVGVLAPKGFQLMTFYDVHDKMVFVPLSTGRTLFGTGRTVQRLYFEPRVVRRARVARGRGGSAASRASLSVRRRSDRHDERSRSDGPDEEDRLRLAGDAWLIGTVTLMMSAVGVANLMIALVQGEGWNSPCAAPGATQRPRAAAAGGDGGRRAGRRFARHRLRTAGVGVLGMFPLTPDMPTAPCHPPSSPPRSSYSAS